MSRFDQAAATWDDNPHRVALAKAVGESLVGQVAIMPTMEVLDYGCGTGLLSLWLAPQVRQVTAADDSAGMLEVLRRKIAAAGLDNVSAVQLNLVYDPLPEDRYDLITLGMTLHHVADTEALLGRFAQLLRPGGILAIADLDREPGVFHDPAAAEGVYHFGFERAALKAQLAQVGLEAARDTTAHVLRKPIAGGQLREFPVFLITAQRRSPRA